MSKLTLNQFAEMLLDSIDEGIAALPADHCEYAEPTPEEEYAEPAHDESLDDDGYITPEHPEYNTQLHILKSIDDVVLNTLQSSATLEKQSAETLLILANIRHMYLDS